jgi:polar amino acid transport system permease protein
MALERRSREGRAVNMDTSLFVRYGPQILQGLEYTVTIWVIGSIFAIVLGFLFGFALSFGSRAVTLALRGYVEFFRGTPLLAQLFLVYYGGPSIGITLDASTVGLLGLSLYGSAYFAEIFRAGFASIPKGQFEAASSFGIPKLAQLRYVALPQIFVLVIPPSTNLLIVLLKDTAILSILTVPELTYQVTGMTIETFAFVEPFAALAAVYWILTELVAFLGRRLEVRVGIYLQA